MSMTARPEPEIATARLLLRPYRRSDALDLAEGIGDFAVARMLARVPHPYGPGEAMQFLDSLDADGSTGVHLAITHGNALIGGIGLMGLNSERELGYWLRMSAWGAGYATEAVRGFLAFLIDELEVDVIRSGVFVDNPASLRVQEKLGFFRTGTRQVFSLARGVKVEHIDTLLPAAALVR